jgi:hypothetical protein
VRPGGAACSSAGAQTDEGEPTQFSRVDYPLPALLSTDLLVRHDITDQMDMADMMQPTEREDPTENKEPAEPTLPTDRTEPIEPTESTDPREPMERTESRDHSDQRELPTFFDMPPALLSALTRSPWLRAPIATGPNGSNSGLWLIRTVAGALRPDCEPGASPLR